MMQDRFTIGVNNAAGVCQTIISRFAAESTKERTSSNMTDPGAMMFIELGSE
jgi:hypothetical protein